MDNYLLILTTKKWVDFCHDRHFLSAIILI